MLDFFKKLMNKHYRMERFSLLFGTLVVSMIVVVCGCIFGHSTMLNEALAQDSSVTDEFTMSKSKAKATVERFYVSDDKTKCFVLFKFSNVANISTDAAQWKGYLSYAKTEGNPVGLQGVPEGIIYFFGTTGYGGVMLINSEGFGQQVLQLTLRCSSPITGGDTAGQDEESSTYTEFDQADIYFNPGASAIEPLPCLNTDSLPDRFNLYFQSVVAYDEAAAKKDLNDQLSKLQSDLALMDEYESRLEIDGILVPERPEYIGDDAVVSAADGTLNLQTSTICQGGFSYDWRSSSVSEGYLDSVKASVGMSSSTDENFFAYMASQGDTYPDDYSSKADWTLSDGTPLSSLNEGGSGTNRYSRLMGDCQTLASMWSTYVQDKKQYQTNLLRELLVLESNTVDVSQTSTQNDGSITVY